MQMWNPIRRLRPPSPFRCIRHSKTHSPIITSTNMASSHSSSLQQILPTAGIMSASPSFKLKSRATSLLTTQRQVKKPFDVQRSPEHGLGLGDSALPPSPFAICGADLTIDHSPDPPPYSGLCPCKQFFTFTAMLTTVYKCREEEEEEEVLQNGK